MQLEHKNSCAKFEILLFYDNFNCDATVTFKFCLQFPQILFISVQCKWGIIYSKAAVETPQQGVKYDLMSLLLILSMYNFLLTLNR